MAQALYTNDITDFSIGTRSEIVQLALVHEPDGANPYVGVFLQVQATGSVDTLASAGRLRIVAEFTDGSSQTLTDSDSPFTNYVIPTQTAWVLVHGDGRVAAEAAPSASSSITYSSTASANEQLRYGSKTLQSVAYYWTAN